MDDPTYSPCDFQIRLDDVPMVEVYKVHHTLHTGANYRYPVYLVYARLVFSRNAYSGTAVKSIAGESTSKIIQSCILIIFAGFGGYK